MAKINYEFHFSKAFTVHFLFVVNINALLPFSRDPLEVKTQWASKLARLFTFFQTNRFAFTRFCREFLFFLKSLFVQLSSRVESSRWALSQSFQKINKNNKKNYNFPFVVFAVSFVFVVQRRRKLTHRHSSSVKVEFFMQTQTLCSWKEKKNIETRLIKYTV